MSRQSILVECTYPSIHFSDGEMVAAARRLLAKGEWDESMTDEQFAGMPHRQMAEGVFCVVSRAAGGQWVVITQKGCPNAWFIAKDVRRECE